jgi:hypothetical protein
MTNLNFRHDPILANRHKWMRIWQRRAILVLTKKVGLLDKCMDKANGGIL